MNHQECFCLFVSLALLPSGSGLAGVYVPYIFIFILTSMPGREIYSRMLGLCVRVTYLER